MPDNTSKDVGGAPTKYDPNCDYIELANNYLITCGREQTKLPKVEEFCDKLEIDDDTAVEWCKLYPKSKFSAAIKRVKSIQKGCLIDDGLYGAKEVNVAMAIFLLKVNHHMVEQEALDVTSKGEKIEGNQIVFSDFHATTDK